MAPIMRAISTCNIVKLVAIIAVCFLGVSFAEKHLSSSDDKLGQAKHKTISGNEHELQVTKAVPNPLTTMSERSPTTPAIPVTIPVVHTTPYSKRHGSVSQTRAQRKALRLARKGKSRRKRRGCKCVQRYMQDVEKRIDEKLLEFRESFMMSRHNAIDNQRVGDALLRLSGDVAEAQNSIRSLTAGLASLRDDLPALKKDVTRVHRHMNQLDSVVANLSRHVDSMETRVFRYGLRSDHLLSVRPHDMTTGQIADQETSTHSEPKPTQCNDMVRFGRMKHVPDFFAMIHPVGVPHSFKVLCKVLDNSGWTIIQRRLDGGVDFYRGWDEYTVGFGSLDGEFWLGLDNIHHLTSQEESMLRVEMEDWNGKKYYATYDHFQVDKPDTKYVLHVSGYRGNAGDSLNSHWENHDGMPFSTKDNDNDARYYDSCAQHYHGAWWFNNCFEAHLNGKYYTKGFHKNYFQRDGIQWNSIHMYSSLKSVQMMVKPAEKSKGSKDKA